jgi:hypothetical protein
VKHAIIRDENDYYRIKTEQEDMLKYSPDIEELYRLALRWQIDAFWVMPGCPFSRTVRKEHFLALGAKGYEVYVSEGLKSRVTGARLRVKGEFKDTFFMFPENKEWKVPQGGDKGVWHVDEPVDLLRLVRLLEREYGTCLWGPSFIGYEVFRRLAEKQKKTLTPLSDLQVPLFLQEAEKMPAAFSWTNFQKGAYIIGVDKNAQFLGAAQSVELGNGPFKLASLYETNFEQTGFWEYNILAYPNFPFPLTCEKSGWMHIDLIQAYQQLGVYFTFGRGLVWNIQGRYLEEWAKQMWKARQTLKAQDEQAASTAKMIANTMMGVLANKGFPHWNRAIVQRAMANQLYSLAALKKKLGITPILVSRDALYFVSEMSDPYQAVPTLLEHEHEQRGYKLINVCAMTPEIEAAFGRVEDARFGVAGVEQAIRKEMKNALR